MSNRTTDNRLWKIAAMKALPAGGLAFIALSVTYMVDYILAGSFFSTAHIAAVGFVLPYFGLMSAIIVIFGNGSNIELANSLGRGEKEKCNRCFSMLFTLMLAIALLFCFFSIVFSKQIVMIFGARDAAVVTISSRYLISYVPCLCFGALNLSLWGVLMAYGHNAETMFIIMIQFLVNISSSLLLISIPSIGFMGLGFGSSVSQLVSSLLCLFLIKKKNFGLEIHLYKYKREEIKTVLIKGMASSGDQLSSNISAGIINNILVSYLGIVGVAVFSVANNIFNMINWAIGGMGVATAPLYGILFGQRDKNALRKVLISSILYSTIYTVIWTAIVCAFLSPLMTFYGLDSAGGIDPNLIRHGIYILLLSIPFMIIIYQFERVFDAAGKPNLAIAFAIMPDSILFPIILFVLVRFYGYNGVWASYVLGYALLLLGYILILFLQKRDQKLSLDHVMCLPDHIRNNVPYYDVSIYNDDTSIVGMSQTIQDILKAKNIPAKTACMTALCLEELTIDMTAHAKAAHGTLDVKMFIDDGVISASIRNSAASYNPLDFEYDKEDFSKLGVYMAQKLAKEIKYSYVYKMNLITIVIESAIQ